MAEKPIFEPDLATENLNEETLVVETQKTQTNVDLLKNLLLILKKAGTAATKTVLNPKK